jgi:DHHC palmitoyltransferase
MVPANIDELIQDEQDRDAASEYGRIGFTQYCSRCRHEKAPRVHHCSSCGKCVLKMDHHCPWIANCVGHRNIKYFHRFLLYLAVGCLFVTILCLYGMLYPPTDLAFKRLHRTPVTFSLVLTASAVFAVTAMLGLHTYLIITNQTTIELYHNRKMGRLARFHDRIYRNPFDLGTSKNWRQVFGHDLWSVAWLLPFARELGDGISYPRIHDEDMDPEIVGPPQEKFDRLESVVVVTQGGASGFVEAASDEELDLGLDDLSNVGSLHAS